MCKSFSRSLLRREGFTLVEALVVAGLVALLAMLLLPAIQAAREASRRTQCLSNLHQIGIAVQEYVDAYRVFPQANCESAILPQLELPSVFELIDYSSSPGGSKNVAARSSRIGVYHCPSDGAGWKTAGTNYGGNFGSGVQAFGFNGVIRYPNGAYFLGEDPSGIYLVAPSSVSDGLSNTALASEILIAENGAAESRRAIWEVPIPLLLASQLDAFAEECDAQAGPFPWPSERGVTWLDPNVSVAGYNHILTPNRNSCKNGDVQHGAYTANSMHPSGVNLLIADGHATFIGNQIERAVWRALGSRNNGETFAY